jgi:hypothetical protein
MNLAPPGKATWYTITPVLCGNGQETPTLAAWNYPSAFDTITVEHMHRVRALAAEGTYRKDPRSPRLDRPRSRRRNRPRSRHRRRANQASAQNLARQWRAHNGRKGRRQPPKTHVRRPRKLDRKSRSSRKMNWSRTGATLEQKMGFPHKPRMLQFRCVSPLGDTPDWSGAWHAVLQLQTRLEDRSTGAPAQPEHWEARAGGWRGCGGGATGVGQAPPLGRGRRAGNDADARALAAQDGRLMARRSPAKPIRDIGHLSRCMTSLCQIPSSSSSTMFSKSGFIAFNFVYTFALS